MQNFMNESNKIRTSFKYNMSFYYQSTIIYFVAFILYAIIRGEFVEGSFKLLLRDPIIYFFAIIVLIALISLLYNLLKDRYLIIEEDRILFKNRFGSRFFTIDQIERIKISRRNRNKAFRYIKIKLKQKRRSIIIRSSDYESEEDLINRFFEIKMKLENK